ncbi:hypothetical protein FJV41_01715 [Myxococcus llanfairpwllgwyngyllgogerychwyrndrobwllllantysiliogogogochensis]|uniref:Uncharacterized protein n=2 Tax=Myxococcus TaxID=32 RepID=A0A540X906_9BACT|nr:hypothetical protein [Myxococcus llanfairpwllgwyngyllgogerychwyrndrobwllllantysiliogogogochensis]TQF17712.1 hypothetical protein FJV41_01715 [Myxococcus llanfairpwllgwyngyllgogerychwyrndrobwllllantysiliogogogochensis]
MAVLLAAVLAQAPGPASLTLPHYRLHLRVDESVDADALRSLAGSGTVLWLSTRSNMLRDSTLEALKSFPEVYVQVRPPLLEAHARQLGRAPRVGLWVDSSTLDASGWHHRLGPRAVAVEVRGVLDVDVASRVADVRPSRVAWFPGPEDASLAGWGEFVQLPGAKLLGPIALGGRDVALGAWSWRSSASRVLLWTDAKGRALGGAVRRIRVREPLDEVTLVALFVQEPATELELEVGADPESLGYARAWVERLEAAVSGSAR